MNHSLGRRLTAEALGTSMLLVAIVGSGIMADRLSGGNNGLALLANVFATGAALVALIHTFGPISGAHLNPVITLCDVVLRGISFKEGTLYIAAQCAGALAGVALTNVMFELPVFHASNRSRTGSSIWLAEVVATFGLLSVIWGCVRYSSTAVPYAVAGYVSAAIWATSSTSFANPAVTIARALSDTFTGIRPAHVVPFIIAQVAGALAATLLFRWLAPALPVVADRVTVPHRIDPVDVETESPTTSTSTGDIAGGPASGTPGNG